MPKIYSDHPTPPYGEGYGGYPPPAQSGEGASGLSASRILAVLKDRWWLLLLGIAVTFAIAWYMVPPDQTTYSAGAVVSMEDTRAEVTGGLVGAGTDTRSTEYMLSQIHVLRSEGLLGAVVDDLDLRLWSTEIPHALIGDVEISIDPEASEQLFLTFREDGFSVRTSNGNQLQGEYGQLVTAPGVSFSLSGRPSADLTDATLSVIPRQAAIQLITASLFAAPRERTAILDITYRDRDGARAQAVINAVALQFQAINSYGVQEQARARREFIQERLLEAQANLERAQQLLRDYQAADRTFGSQQRLDAERTTLQALDAQRRQLEDERRLFASFLSRIDGSSGETIDQELRTLMASPEAANSPLLTQLYGQLTQYQTELDMQIAAGLAPTHQEIQRLSSLIDRARGSIPDAARTQISSIDMRIESVDQQRVRSAQTLRALPETGTEEIRLIDQVEAARGLVGTLNTEYQNAQLTESIEASQVQIIDMARYATPVTVGNRQRSLIVALVFGLMLGGGSALLLELTNKSVRGRGELEDMLALPALGIIPRIGPESVETRKPIAARLLRKSKTNGNGKGVDRGAKIRPGAASISANPIPTGANGTDLRDFHSMAAEAYRILRTNLVFLVPDREMRTLLVTSAASGEGKTTTAANLAVAFARQGKRVLLVDGDLRRPRIHQIFGVSSSPGFTDVLIGDSHLGEAVRPTAVERLHVLPRGKFDERAAELLSGDAGRSLMAKFQDHWDLVIFDTSPVLLTADAAAVAPMTDGVLLVVCAGRTSRDAAKQAIQQLQVVGAPVLGFVLNDPESIGERYGEYKYAKEYYAVEV